MCDESLVTTVAEMQEYGAAFPFPVNWSLLVQVLIWNWNKCSNAYRARYMLGN